MERLTRTSDKGGVAFTFDLDITCEKSEIKKILKLAEKIKEYEDLEEQGKLLKLPCAVGDTVYRPYINTVIEMEVISIVVQHIIQIYYYGTSYRSVIEDFGKTVFLTREEAEAALKEMGE